MARTRKHGGKSGQMVYLTGQDELDRQLKNLAVATQRKLFRRAAREAARPVLAAAKKYAPSQHRKYENRDKLGRYKSVGKRRTGTLVKAIKLRAIKRNRAGRIGVQVTLGEGYFKGKTYYGAFVELGTSKQKEQGFMRRAADENREKVANIFQREIQKEILAEVARG